jgi:hypothetical protein
MHDEGFLRKNMTLLKKFSPPAFLDDFDDIPEQASAWNEAVDGWFESVVKSEKSHVKSASGKTPGIVQFYNPARFDPKDVLIEQQIVWSAFPKELLKQYGPKHALIEADRLRTLDQYSAAYDSSIHKRTFYRPQNEYCEWHIVRDPNTQKIVRIVFSSEPPEYWQAMFGDEMTINGKQIKFPGNRHKVLALYRQFCGSEVQMDDLICQETIPGPEGQPPVVQKGAYNLFNKWNTIYGIAHLCSPPNSLQAEIALSADATILREDATGRPVVLPEPLICCAQYGEPDRNSDPTIGSSVNALARIGARITLLDPVGVYMDHIDTSGWATPDGSNDVAECVHVDRGCAAKGLIERLRIEVPPERGFTVGDITIGGTKIHHGGQIADCITVKLIAGATNLGAVRNAPIPCSGRCCVDPQNAVLLNRGVPLQNPRPAGTVNAFTAATGLQHTPKRRTSRAVPPRNHVRRVP